MSAKQFFVTGISTEVGKTVISAILTEALEADYWKPVQSGDLDFGDADKVKSWISNEKSVFHPERFRLNTPASPHWSAEIDGVEIKLEDFKLPQTENHLIVEGAGGLLVPLNDQDLLIDLMEQLNLPVILVSRNYLGSINHTLLSIEALERRNIPIAGIIFNGQPTPSTENYILNYTQIPLIGHVKEAEGEISIDFVKAEAEKIKNNIHHLVTNV
jgi:dethiobiotin synthetase